MDNRAHIAAIAVFLRTHDKIMSAEELAEHLNRNGLRTTYDTPYEGGRGVYRLIHATYNWLSDVYSGFIDPPIPESTDPPIPVH